jgi:hypothetical protein
VKKKVLLYLVVVAAVTAAVSAWLARPQRIGCEEPAGFPCDPRFVESVAAVMTMYAALAILVIALITVLVLRLRHRGPVPLSPSGHR